MDGIREKFISSAAKLGIGDALSGADAIVCALSGGADSCALLLLLKECYANAEIRAFHVNHMIRGEEADRDEEHCRALCGRLGVPFAVKKTDVPAMAEKLSLGLEEAARTARYSAFDEYRKSLLAEGKKDVLFATAHNADDNLETLIFNLIRGSGAHGLSGIAPRRGYIVRPMLSLSSEEIRDFMRSRGESFVTDSTNADTSYTRNKIRTQVIPILRTVSPACERAAYSASLLIRRDDEYLFSEAQKAAGGQDIDSRFRYRRASRSRAFPRGDAHVFGGARRAHRSEIVTGRRMHATHPRRKALRSLASGGGLDVHIGRKYCLRSRRKKRNCTVL